MGMFRIGKEVCVFNDDDLKKKKILNTDEYSFYTSYAIPYNDETGMALKLLLIQEKIISAIKSKKLPMVDLDKKGIKKNMQIKTDYINGPNGSILGQHDGKYYDSKAAYYASLKASGHMIVESGMTQQKREMRGDYNVRKELKEAAQKHGLIG